MSLSDKLAGSSREHIPNWAFVIMSFIMKVMDIVGYHDKNFKTLKIEKGFTVVDYGCGPARYIQRISNTIGNEGKLFAIDIHPMAIKKVKKKINKQNLSNVEAVLIEGYDSKLPSNIADQVLALDMFHMIENAVSLLNEFHRIVKPDGEVIIEDGHQAREITKKKILNSDRFLIISEHKNHVRCKPINKK